MGGSAPAGDGPAGQASTKPEGEWLRVHPASPFIRGWVALAAIGFFFGRDTFERMLQGRPLMDEMYSGRVPFLIAGGGLVLVLSVLGFILTWYFTRYQVAEGYVRVNTGCLFKQQRQARLDRVQAIDIVQPLLARIFGLAELKFEVADAGESAVRLAYLRIDDARQLRATILARAAGLEPDPERPDEALPEAPEFPVLSVPPSRLIGSLLLSEQSFFVVVGAVASVVLSTVTDNRGFYFYLIPAALGLAAAYWGSFNKGYNFTAAISPDGIRLRYGLLDTQAQTLPPGRIQALKVTQPPLWRIFGWYRMQVNVAGYGGPGSNGEGASRTTLLPVGVLADVMRMLSLVLPDPGTQDPARVFAAGLTGIVPADRSGPAGQPAAAEAAEAGEPDSGFVTSPRRVRLLAPLGWRRNGFTATDTALLIRSGRLWRELVVVPHQRTQSMALHQGPLARRFRVADLVLHTTAGPVSPRVIQAGLDEARALFDAQAARAREARKRQTSEQWLAQVAPAAEPDHPQNHQEGPQHG
ncbi:PH domain-containing protein [Arthrobacter sp. ISL-69]|uniref:PH domain-containing protein n=1 Tax=Arthrobacter sp. ISL-69 TaxID=2819113 RepID=UPI001BE716E4|nr:PH domain-containing protein [Arthrobacter sp. ISL-69]MBT2535933.1 PH domain-containing protein [Arthrobacter sp. ISL-69]